MLKSEWKIIRREGLDLKYSPDFLSCKKANLLFQTLEEELVYFTGDLAKVKVFGKWHPIPRQQAVSEADDQLIVTLGNGIIARVSSGPPSLPECTRARKIQSADLHCEVRVAFGDEGLTYKYSGLTVPARPWPPALLHLRKDIADRIGIDYNFVLVNRYRSGNDYMGEHKDDEAELDREAGIASISLGAVRDFIFRHGDSKKKGGKRIPPLKIPLAHGSCLQMRPPTNTFWYHSLPKRKSCTSVRINLTFRKVLLLPQREPS